MSEATNKYAIIRAQGKQFGVTEGKIIVIDQLDGEIGSEVSFAEVLFISDNGATKVGTPTIENAKVQAKIVSHSRAKKVVTFKKKITHGYTKKQGHRQYQTKLLIEKIAA